MLGDLIDDLLIRIISCLSIHDIIRIRLTCWRLCRISQLKIVWTNACKIHVLDCGLPFPATEFHQISEISDLERKTLHAYGLSQRWMTPIVGDTLPPGREILALRDTPNHGTISLIRFIPGYNERWLLTITRSIWDIITIWDTKPPDGDGHIIKSSEWCPKRALFNGLCLNSDSRSPGTLAIAVIQNTTHEYIQILSLEVDQDRGRLTFVTTIDSPFRPMTLQSNLLAFSNDSAQTVIWDWTNNNYAVLQHSMDEELLKRYDQCNHVLLLHEAILVARARSIYLFPFPKLRPSSAQTLQEDDIYFPWANHSFGWIDGVSAAINATKIDPGQGGKDKLARDISILVRAESEDFWVRERATLDLYSLPFDHDYLSHHVEQGAEARNKASYPIPPPYTFPPTRTARCPSVNGQLRCREIVLGSYGTAVWILPKDTSHVGLVSPPLYLSSAGAGGCPMPQSHERLVATVFPHSPLYKSDSMVERRTVFMNDSEGSSWSAMDYDEVNGRVVLGTTLGTIHIIAL